MTLLLEDLDEGDADEQKRHAAKPQGGALALRQAEPAIAVHEQRRDLLTGDRQANRGGGADQRDYESVIARMLWAWEIEVWLDAVGLGRERWPDGSPI
jgi:hypothetical protein